MVGRIVNPLSAARFWWIPIFAFVVLATYGVLSLKCSIFVLDVANASGQPAGLTIFRTALAGEDRNRARQVWKGTISERSARLNLPYFQESAFEFRVETADGRIVGYEHPYVTLHAFPQASLGLDGEGEVSFVTGSGPIDAACGAGEAGEACRFLHFLGETLACPIQGLGSR